MNRLIAIIPGGWVTSIWIVSRVLVSIEDETVTVGVYPDGENCKRVWVFRRR